MRSTIDIRARSPYAAAHVNQLKDLEVLLPASLARGQETVLYVPGLGAGSAETLYCMDMERRQIQLGEELRPQ